MDSCNRSNWWNIFSQTKRAAQSGRRRANVSLKPSLRLAMLWALSKPWSSRVDSNAPKSIQLIIHQCMKSSWWSTTLQSCTFRTRTTSMLSCFFSVPFKSIGITRMSHRTLSWRLLSIETSHCIISIWSRSREVKQMINNQANISMELLLPTTEEGMKLKQLQYN